MRIKEIEERIAAIKKEIETRGAEMTVDDIGKLDIEAKALMEERKGLIATAEKRTALLGSIAEGITPATVIRSFPPEQRKSEETDRFDTLEYRKAFMNYVVRGIALPAEYRADAISKTTDVGAVIATTTLNQIIQKLESTGMILPLVTRTSYKGGLEIPVSSVKPVATWVNEGQSSDKQKHDIKKVGAITFAYHKLRCAVAVSLEVDNMALSAFEAMLINNIVEAMTKAIEKAIISGTGTGQPKGILTGTAPASQQLKLADIAYKDLIDAEAALPQAYENGAVWCMSKKTFMLYYGLTDDVGQPIGRVNYGIAGKPERYLLGRPVICCDYVTSFDASISVGTKFAFLFNFKDFVLNTNYVIGIKKYEDNDTDDIVTKGIMLVDGKVVDINSLVTLEKKA